MKLNENSMKRVIHLPCKRRLSVQRPQVRDIMFNDVNLNIKVNISKHKREDPIKFAYSFENSFIIWSIAHCCESSIQTVSCIKTNCVNVPKIIQVVKRNLMKLS